MRAMFRGKSLWVTLVVLLGMGVLVRLGIWQLDRLQQRRARNAELRKALEGPAIELTGRESAEFLDSMEDRSVFARGEFDHERQIVILLQNLNGRPGVHLVTPLLIEGSEQAVLVDRGWIPEADSADDRTIQYDHVGEVIVEGTIRPTQTLSRDSSAAEPPPKSQREWYRIDVAAIQAQLPYPLLPIFVAQAPIPGQENQLPIRAEREIDLSDGPHLGYAIQWFLFSLILATIYVAIVNQRISEEQTGRAGASTS